MTRRVQWVAVAAVCAIGALAVLGTSQGWIGGSGGSPAVVATSVATAAASPVPGSTLSRGDDPVRPLFDDRRSGVEVEGTGVVSRILADDHEGSRHQKFLLKTPDGVSVLIAHNIDIAPRLDGLSVGDRVDFLGDYEWSEKGGTVHWTHHDPSGQHQNGWLRWNGRTYA